MSERRGEVAWEPGVECHVEDPASSAGPLLPPRYAAVPRCPQGTGLSSPRPPRDGPKRSLQPTALLGRYMAEGYTEQVPTVQKTVSLGPSQTSSHHLAQQHRGPSPVPSPPRAGRHQGTALAGLRSKQTSPNPHVLPFWATERRSGASATVDMCPGGLHGAGKMEPRQESRTLCGGVGTRHLACMDTHPKMNNRNKATEGFP